MCATTTSPELARSKLCPACRSIFSGDTLKNDSGEVAHHSLDHLAVHAKSGCQLCLTITTSLPPDSHRYFPRDTPEKDGSLGFALVAPIARDQARVKFRVVRNAEFVVSTTTANGNHQHPDENGKRVIPRQQQTATPTPSLGSNLSLPLSDGAVPPADDFALTCELILMNPRYAVEPGVRSIPMDSMSTASASALEVARQWIDECSFNHMKCNVNSEMSTSWKPTHLLDVSIKGAGGKQGLKLVDGLFLDPLTEYVTLSHCWGTGKGVRLHKGTLKSLRQGVGVEGLPKTYREAAWVAKELGYRYLWVDALCVMHDSEQECLREIEMMGKIYGEATLNLAATGSMGDEQGLIRSRRPESLSPGVVDVNGIGVQDGCYKLLRATVWKDLVDKSPLSDRSWAFQERCLAKRTLHFTRNEVLWECQQMCCSEVFPKGLPATIGGGGAGEEMEVFDKRTHHQRHGNWTTLVRLYSKGRMRHSSDKLLALSGLARQYMAKNRLKEHDYLAGMWRNSLPAGLLWRVDRGRRPRGYRAPSWSWPSLDGEVCWPDAGQGESGKGTCLEVMEVEIKRKRQKDAFGQLEAGKLKVRGFMARGVLRRDRDYWSKTSCEIHCPRGQLDLDSVWFDEKLPKLGDTTDLLQETIQVYLLPVLDVVDRVAGLLLCSNIKRGEFRRMGVFEVSRYDQGSWDRFRTVMKGDPDMNNYEERLDHTNGYWFASDYTYTINVV